MIILEEQFSPRVNPADENYPFGSIKDNTSPGANDGTPLAAVWGNDWEGFAQAAMTEAGITPSGLPDTAQDSQLLAAVKVVASGALRPSVIEAMRRTYAEAGYLVKGKFTVGSVVTSSSDVLIDEASGGGYSFGGPYPHTVVAGETPISGGWTDRSPETSGLYVASGLDASGATPCTEALQREVDAISGGVLLIPPGTYDVGDITIKAKAPGSTGVQGGFRIEATGAKFIGSGKIIVDGCKRVQINGLDAPNHDLCFRGQWWGKYTNMRFKKLRLGDALGSDFQSNYWTDFDTCIYQAVVFEAMAPSNSNAFTWTNCSCKGNAGQGFSGTSNYAIELLSNQNSQNWKFNGGDISYHNLGIYNIGAGNTTGQVELLFAGVYFDTLYPKPINRYASRVVTRDCHSANDLPHSTTLPAVARGSHDSYRVDRAAAWAQFSGVNFVPNGDFRVGLPLYVGAGLPIGSTGGATITAMAGAGLFGRYLNVNQPATTGTTRFRPLKLPFNGRYTAVLVLRNAEVGSRTIRLAFNSLYHVATIGNAEWTLFTMTCGADIIVGDQPDIQILSDDSTPFNIDVAYAAITFGEGGQPFVPAPRHGEINGSIPNFNPPSIASGSETKTTVAAVGANPGDMAVVGFARDTLGVKLSAEVTAADTVTVTFRNDTGATIDLLSANLNVRVFKASY